MAQLNNGDSTIGKRIGRLLQQYELRIRYAEYKSKLMEEERLKASACGASVRSMQSAVAKNAWEVYAKNLVTKRDELVEAVKRALICYSAKERNIWWLYFVENKSCYEIEPEVNINYRTIQRIVASMKSDMELKFDSRLPAIGDSDSPKWGAAELATFLKKDGRPNENYVGAVRDLLDYGVIDIDTLEFDPEFQDYLVGKRRLGDV